MPGTIANPSPRTLASYGCDAAFWRRLRDIGHAMRRAGAGRQKVPLRAFANQRGKAINHRGIGWELTLPQWWEIWESSGHWHERGQGRGYMMCRKGDEGPYAVGNVFIGPGSENCSAPAKRRTDLPIGVGHVTKKYLTKPYRAYSREEGKFRHLGYFATVAEAEAAYRHATAQVA